MTSECPGLVEYLCWDYAVCKTSGVYDANFAFVVPSTCVASGVLGICLVSRILVQHDLSKSEFFFFFLLKLWAGVWSSGDDVKLGAVGSALGSVSWQLEVSYVGPLEVAWPWVR